MEWSEIQCVLLIGMSPCGDKPKLTQCFVCGMEGAWSVMLPKVAEVLVAVCDSISVSCTLVSSTHALGGLTLSDATQS